MWPGTSERQLSRAGATYGAESDTWPCVEISSPHALRCRRMLEKALPVSAMVMAPPLRKL